MKRLAGGGWGEVAMEQQQQQQQRPVIWWERFLPRRSLRVLLVESDDSTRHIVSALLRKCSYNVSTVADGMKAWDVLEEKEYRFDLVLSEVEMPSLSCMGLLCKIMGCELSRNIPVVMMSSQDSVMVVFNCMRKGAVDFLVKPLRKNELKNLWQHVWRKNCSISHSNALESTYDNQMKSEHVSGTNTVANNVFLHVDSDLRIEENHNEENDGQSSSSKPETKSQSVQRYQDSSMFEVRNSDLLSTKNLEKPFHDDMLMGPARKKHFVPNGGSNSSRNRGEASNLLEKTVVDDINRGDDGICIRSAPERECKSGTDTVGDSESHSSFPKSSSQNNITDFIGPVANRVCCYAASEKDSNREKFQCVATDSSFGSNATNSGAHPLWELSLRGPSLNSSGKQGLQESHVLMQSSGSAFSKYGGSDSRNSFQKSKCSPSSLLAANNEGKNQSTSSNGPGMEDASSCRPWMLKSCHAKKAQVIRCHQVSSGSNEDSQHFGACLSKETGNVGLSNSDHDNQSKVFHTTQLRHEVPFFPVEGMSLQGMQAGYGAMIQPLFYSNLPPHCVIASETTNDFLSSAPFGQNCNNLEYDDSSKQNCCHYNHERLIADVTVDMGDGNPQTLISTDIEQTNQRGSFQQTVVNGGGSSRNEEMMEAGLTVVGTERETEYDFQSCNIKVLDCKQSQREAALIKFRMKMKERCFEKKVRYQSRKKLAERRPRVKGQFVRQSAIMSPVVTLEEDH